MTLGQMIDDDAPREIVKKQIGPGFTIEIPPPLAKLPFSAKDPLHP